MPFALVLVQGESILPARLSSTPNVFLYVQTTTIKHVDRWQRYDACVKVMKSSAHTHIHQQQNPIYIFENLPNHFETRSVDEFEFVFQLCVCMLSFLNRLEAINKWQQYKLIWVTHENIIIFIMFSSSSSFFHT